MVDITQYTSSGGCACKLPARELSRVLGGRSFGEFGDVSALALDEAVESVSGRRLLVHTVDFGSPVAPDPYKSGVISASNSLSDIYACGAQPIAADILLELPQRVQERASVGANIVSGVKKVLQQEGVTSIGGHTTLGSELRIGCAVTGIVSSGRLRTHGQAKIDNSVVITKPIGSGLIFSGLKTGILSLGDCEFTIELASKTNRQASEILARFGCKTCTDVTGYGLLGAALELASASRLTIELSISKIPVVAGARAVLSRGVVPPLGEETLFNSDSELFRAVGVTLEDSLLIACPETSGGLLGLLPQEQAESVAREFHSLSAWVIGRVVPWSHSCVRLCP